MDKEQFANLLDTSYLPSELLSILLKSDLLTKADKEKIINSLTIRDLELDNDDDIEWLSGELNDQYYCYASDFFQDLLLNKEIEEKVFNCLMSECEF